MSVFRRIGNAARGLRAGWTYPVKVSQGRVSRTPRARSILMWPEYMNAQAQWVMHDLSSYARDGFEINAVIYSAIMFKVRTAFGCLLRAYRGTRDEPELLPANNELSNLLDRPNPHQSFAELQAEMLVFFNLFGDSYTWFKRRAGLEFPECFYTLRPDRVIHLYDTGELKGFLFVPEGMAIQDGIPLLPEDTMHVKLPNPLDPYLGLGKGLSPVAPMAQSGDVDNAATSWLKLFFDQGTMPMSMITTDMPLTDEDIAEARERWMMQYGNWANWVEPIIMGQGAKYQKIGATLNELDLGRLDARNESRMVMPFGVPLNLIESRPELVQSTYSNKETDYKSFLTNTLIPELQMFETEWRFFLRSANGRYFAQYDYKGIPGWWNKREYIADVAAAWTASAVTRAEYRQAIGLPVTEADEIYQVPVMIQFVPVGELPAPPAPPALPAPEETPPPEQAPEGEEETETGAAGAEETAEEEATKALPLPTEQKLTDQQRAFVAQTRQIGERWQDKAILAARKSFEQDRRKILAIITKAQKAAYKQKASVSWQIAQMEITAYLHADSKKYWSDEWTPLLGGISGAQAQALASTFGKPLQVDQFLSEDWFQAYRLVFVDPISATSEREIATLLQTAAAEGWSVPKVQENLELLFRQWIAGDALAVMQDMSEEELGRSYFAEQRLPPYRAEMVARTEIMRASNASSHNLYRDWGVTQKEWFAALDDRTRPSHREAHGQRVGIDDTFTVGGAKMQYPGDPNGPLDEFINCRCTELPVLGE